MTSQQSMTSQFPMSSQIQMTSQGHIKSRGHMTSQGPIPSQGHIRSQGPMAANKLQEARQPSTLMQIEHQMFESYQAGSDNALLPLKKVSKAYRALQSTDIPSRHTTCPPKMTSSTTSQHVGPHGSMPLIQQHADDDIQRFAHTKAFVTSEWKRLHDLEAGCGSHTMTGDVQSRMQTTDSLSKMKSGKSSRMSSPPDVMASTSSNREMIDIPAKHCGGQIKDVLQSRYHENTNIKRNIPHGYRPITSQKAQTSTTDDELA